MYNVDGTRNQSGSVKEELDLIMTFKGHKEKMTFSIMNIGDKNIIIGHNWLKKHNPEIDWVSGNITMTRCPSSCRYNAKERKTFLDLPALDKEQDESEPEQLYNNEELLQYLGMTNEFPLKSCNGSDEIRCECYEKVEIRSAEVKKDETPLSERIPPEFHDFLHVFEKKAST